MDEGDVLVRDPRTVHRASPNLTGSPRPMLVTAVTNDPDRAPRHGMQPLAEYRASLAMKQRIHGADADHADIIDQMYDHLFTWARRMSQRTTISDAQINADRDASLRKGILLGRYDEDDVPKVEMSKYSGPARPIPGNRDGDA